ncbi:hypothetical protein [Acaryochloris marina]|uniref:Uncharacterized protein n=1 Tax=Acaryochloris marina (strain MBIC 11017) TaxID=329726 RepID=B0CEM1_ACAM1|nr:hypothetical protein [Acaryochloris marina]ABW28126.1 hypothetical protein AM1_3130 [Acaryochloris marina MBIC11017]BDM77163.1 hypothetical protein AM10699_00370 [Acaryochloris marina MBIC10699]
MLNTIKPTEQHILIGLGIWGSTVAIAGSLNWFTLLPLPSLSILVVVSLAMLLLLYYTIPAIYTYLASLNPRHLILFHLWRIGAGITFLYYGSQALLPRQFVINAGYGDLAVGLLVPLILIGQPSLQKYLVFHLLGQIDFAIAVGTGLTFTVLQVPLMENIATFPIVLIPLFGVPVTGASSIVAIDTLLKHRRELLHR